MISVLIYTFVYHSLTAYYQNDFINQYNDPYGKASYIQCYTQTCLSFLLFVIIYGFESTAKTPQTKKICWLYKGITQVWYSVTSWLVFMNMYKFQNLLYPVTLLNITAWPIFLGGVGQMTIYFVD